MDQAKFIVSTLQKSMQESISGLRDEMQKSINGLRDEMQESIAELRKEMQEADKELLDKMAYFEYVYGKKIDLICDYIKVAQDEKKRNDSRFNKLNAKTEKLEMKVIVHEQEISNLKQQLEV